MRAFRSMTSSPWLISASLMARARRMCDQPRIALRGVLSSWERVARNSSFIELARSASPRANLSLSRSSFRSAAACCTVSNSRALSIATAACAAMPTTNRSARSLNTPGEGWPKNSPPMTSPDREITGTAR